MYLPTLWAGRYTLCLLHEAKSFEQVPAPLDSDRSSPRGVMSAHRVDPLESSSTVRGQSVPSFGNTQASPACLSLLDRVGRQLLTLNEAHHPCAFTKYPG